MTARLFTRRWRSLVVLFALATALLPRSAVGEPGLTSAQSAQAPSPRCCAAMAYDPVGRQVVLFGGLADLVPLDDTWTWDGATWTERHPGTSPHARWGARMVNDPARREVVMFGGYGFNDTWTWDGADWVEQDPPVSPPPQGEVPGLAFDAATQLVVLFSPGAREARAATWTWDGAAWTELDPLYAPPWRDHPGMARTAGKHVVLYGGEQCFDEPCHPGYKGDTWTWNGASWIRERSRPRPPDTSAMGLAYDQARGSTTMFGGYTWGAYLDTTWSWDGRTWTQLFPAKYPSARADMAMAYDNARQQIVLFGGWGCCYTYWGDTWTWDGTTWTEH